MTDNREEQLEKRVKELEHELGLLEKDTIHDKLTGLKTRAFLEEELGTYLESIALEDRSRRKEHFGFKNISIIFFDIDHFKKINDTYGHSTGDEVLKQVAEVLKNSLREGDTIARWGGEEIVVSLLGASEEDAVKKASEMRHSVSKITFSQTPDLKVTVSAGVVVCEKNMSIEEIVQRADKALYKAKETGRNKVIRYSEIS